MLETLTTIKEVLLKLSISKTHLYRLIAAGEFPKPVRVSRQRVAFIEREVNEWLQKRIDARDGSNG